MNIPYVIHYNGWGTVYDELTRLNPPPNIKNITATNNSLCNIVYKPHKINTLFYLKIHSMQITLILLTGISALWSSLYVTKNWRNCYWEHTARFSEYLMSSMQYNMCAYLQKQASARPKLLRQFYITKPKLASLDAIAIPPLYPSHYIIFS